MKFVEQDETGRNSLGWDNWKDEKPLYCELQVRCDDVDPLRPLNPSNVKDEPSEEYVAFSCDDIDPRRPLNPSEVKEESVETVSQHRGFAEGDGIKLEFCNNIQSYELHGADLQKPLTNTEVKEEPMDELIIDDIPYFGMGTDSISEYPCFSSEAKPIKQEICSEENIQGSQRVEFGDKDPQWLLNTAEVKEEPMEVYFEGNECVEGSSAFEDLDCSRDNSSTETADSPSQDDCSHSEMPRSRPPTPACENEDLSDPNITVHRLVEKDFQLNSVSIEEQNKIIRAGRATPALRNHLAKDGCNPNGIAPWEYEVIPWLTALRLPKSLKIGNYHCWPCLLFAKETKQFCGGQWYPRWTLHGGVQRHTFWEAINEHSSKTSHRIACSYLKLRESELEDSIKSQNMPTPIDVVKSNGFLLTVLIQTLCLTNAKFGSTETGDVGYADIMRLVITFYPELQQSIGKSPTEANIMSFVSKHASKVLPYVESIMSQKIRLEFVRSEFVSIIYEDTKVIVDKSTVIAVIIRYLAANGDVSERIAKFVILLDSPRDSNSIYRLHTEVVSELGIQNKLVGVTFSGTVLAPNSIADFLLDVSRTSPHARFFHHPDHNLKELILQSLSHLEECQNFLQTIADLVKFLAINGTALATFIGLNKPNSQLDEKICFSVDIISTLRNHFPLVIEFFSEVLQNLSNCEAKKQAQIFKKFFEEQSNRFLIAVIAAIMDAIGELSQVMENYYDHAKWTAQAQTALDNLKLLKKNRPEYFMYLSFDSTMQNHSDHDYTHWAFNEEEIPKGWWITFRNIIEMATISVVQRAQLSWVPYLNKKYTKDSDILRVSEIWNSKYGFASSNEYDQFLMFFKILKETEPYRGTKSLNAAALKRPQLLSHYFRLLTFLQTLKDAEPNLMQKSIPEILMVVESMNVAPKFKNCKRFLRLCALTVPPAKSTPSSPSTVLKLKSYLKNSSDTSSFNATEALLFLAQELVRLYVFSSPGFIEEVIDHYVRENELFVEY